MNKPVILLGNGIRGNPNLIEYLLGLGIPILTTWMAADLIPEDHPTFCGRPGIYGQRAANIIQQKATHLYCYGARLDEQQVGYRYDNFAPLARKYIYDIDIAEGNKLPHNSDWHLYAPGHPPIPAVESSATWLSWCKALYARLRPELDGVDNLNFVDPFRFLSWLSDYAKPDDIIVSGDGTAGECFLQAFKVKHGQRLIQLSTNGAMGYDIPLAIGAAIGTGRRVLCVTGDGSFQLNAQELEVMRRLNLPIQFFVWNNNGYASIRNMQKARFGRVVGADPASGFTIPTIGSLAECYRLSFGRVEIMDEMPAEPQETIIELMIDPDYVHLPKVGTRLVDGKWQQDSMEDMTPKLAELREIMDA
jgi:acetolactate synthase-1/2/3 large subunit